LQHKLGNLKGNIN